MEDELRLVGCFLQEVLGIKELFVIIVKYGNVQEMTCGFVHTVTVALTQQCQRIHMQTTDRSVLQTMEEIFARLVAELPPTSNESGFLSLEVKC